jgi:hypothetical protein
MVDSWIRKFSNPLKIKNLIVIHRIPHLLNTPIGCLDARFFRFSTAVEEKVIRKTILALHCQLRSNNPGIVHRLLPPIRSNKSCFPSTPSF